jgi:ATP-dependent Lhr-like helicase
VQQWVWRQGWQELRDAQVKAIPPILEQNRDVVIAAATAAGKTEAAFLPILSRLIAQDKAAPGVDVLYVSPLKALINDQHGRLEQLSEQLDVPVHRWHGDVAGSKKSRLLKSPEGVLLITPESLEALFVLHGTGVAAFFATLEYVVVDELHSFVDSERGAQLQSLLHRVELLLRRHVPRIALSATLGDMHVAADFLRPGHGDDAVLIDGDDDGQELRMQLRGYRIVPPRLSTGEIAEREASGEEIDAAEVTEGDKVAIAEHIFGVLRGTDNLVFANARSAVEQYADLLASISAKAFVPNQFLPHHGSLSKDLREYVEQRLKGGEQPITALCTSTLEMGIDLGDVQSVAQIGAPPSVASLRQRLGRSGRRGDPAVLRMYIAEAEITERTPPPDQLRAQLVQSIAMVELLLEGWIERPSLSALHLSTLVQQLLSLVAQHGGVQPADAYGALCGHGPFQRVTSAMFAALLRALGAGEIIMQSSDGLLLLETTGERIVNHYSFYAAFTSPEEYRLVGNGRQLGTIPVDRPIVVGQLMIFAGRRWRVTGVDSAHKVIDLERSAAGRPPQFSGDGGRVDDAVRKQMFDIYKRADLPEFLDVAARDLLTEARENFARFDLAATSVVALENSVVIFPWVGDRVVGTVVAVLAAGGLEVANDGIAVTVEGMNAQQLREELDVLVPGGPPEPVELAAAVANKAVEKYDHLLSEELLDAEFAARALDPASAWKVLGSVLEDLRRLR